ncbi:hypothetical protein PS874_00251 [Pseudomonas fluorescens]|uniref:RHS repeat-associated core domain-containing protein n=1 Tax=Pseudomonas silesiensis TaxID=1853130 RepID=A0A191YXE2_9PSED|nr:RHS repeat-associated core domain-containing protein [Pseudomonas silesiensis]ANJ57557.1 hypothetical protein PMA3_21290 [Pseudomonas silesiensis]VVO52834.1 hypothetical protein PS874_00251 [Pseudomonas fluorescens]
MTVQRETLLCRYRYDPLDRIANCAPLNHCSVQRFYRKNRLATEIQGQVQYSVFEHESQLMAQQQREGGRVDSALLATDLQRSVLHSVAVDQHQQPIYSPYGHRSPENGLGSLLGFDGERRDPVTGHYLLGNGYRAFNPVLMRFNSPDSLSPFGKGGVNAYAYCLGDPVNGVDPNGHSPLFSSYFRFLERAAGRALSGNAKNAVSNLPFSAQAVGKPVAKKSAGLASKLESLNTPQIDALDLAVPKALNPIDQGRMRHAIAVRVQAEETLNTARENYSVLQRFAASPPLKEIPNFDASHIVNQSASRRLVFAERGVADAEAALEHAKNNYFARYPQDYKEVAATIRSTERRKSFQQ